MQIGNEQVWRCLQVEERHGERSVIGCSDEACREVDHFSGDWI